MVNVIMADLVPLDRRAKYMGMIQLSGAFGLCSGVIIGAAASERASWRWWVKLFVLVRNLELLTNSVGYSSSTCLFASQLWLLSSCFCSKKSGRKMLWQSLRTSISSVWLCLRDL